SHEFVRITQATWIEDAIVADHERVLERSAEGVASAPQFRDVLHEAEGACTCNLFAEALRLDVERERLLSDQRMIEFNLRLDPKAVRIGTQFTERLVARNT